MKHAVAALKESAQSDGLTAKNLSIGIVGKDCAFHVLDDEHVQPYLDMLDSDEVAEPTAAAVAVRCFCVLVFFYFLIFLKPKRNKKKQQSMDESS